ncbi:hypothetical protein SPRG_12216 [Saprolegnia parasitica CBS 223.65]|uniref:Zinc finger PHD-type domain-containing protein n=1 Tax=Saprolegnia parasitica (strain CBS 223.65) TaxID=695850 RepID=A0A067C5A6_SAPPC|nr:hypothetical protein SPRG_12216 [Saprolegnia parasitica CBS 223.65]KDO22007.1 hypothetical protein SPRG_12216 [Saprolegnia parasitica CBS 223.65]|eukprot:XP_012207251.1 hypothetical protein SPRG_12216 [Saprolegnia parasitica CBS 223.65]
MGISMRSASLPTHPGELSVDFCSLQADTLQRYVDYHQLPLPSSATKDDLAIRVAAHFSETVTMFEDEKATIMSFLTYARATPATQPIKALGDAKRPRAATPDDAMTSGDDISNDSNRPSKKAKRKEKRYCICDGESFGAMIACDNNACSDRSNWYHMQCVGLETTPETCRELQHLPSWCLFRKPALSTTYGDMISHALRSMPRGEGTFKDICEYIEAQYESQLNWKLESDQRKSPVWKSSVRKILFSNSRFKRHAIIKGVFCLVPSTAA